MSLSKFNPNFHFHMDTRPEYSGDLTKEDTSIKELNINGDTKSLNRLIEFKELNKLWIYNLRQNQFDTIVSQIDPEMLLISGIRTNDLTKLATLKKLRHLCLDWNTKATSLWDLTAHNQLETLEIRDFSALHDISELAVAENLKGLSLSGGVWKPLRVHTLEPLATLTSLKYLALRNLKVEDDSIRPLASLKQLEELILSNQFLTEDYAYLSVMLPDVTCSSFAAYERFTPAIDDKNIMVTGKRKPLLNSTADRKKLDKYIFEFEQLQKKYKQELSKLDDE